LHEYTVPLNPIEHKKKVNYNSTMFLPDLIAGELAWFMNETFVSRWLSGFYGARAL